MSGRRPISTVDLSVAQQEHVRNALLLLRQKVGTWEQLARALKFEPCTLVHVSKGRRSASVVLAFRIATFVNICMTTLIAGEYPNKHTCPRCGCVAFRRAVRS